MAYDHNLLTIRGLHTYFYTEDGVVKALNGVNLEIGHGECLGLVGESGSGKSVTALSILRLIQDPPGKIVEGEIWFEGENLLEFSTDRMCEEVRGGKIAMIFQDPMTSLNPVFRVGAQVAEAIKIHQHVPLEKNSAPFAEIYKANDAEDAITLIVVKGQGHNVWEGFFQNKGLIEFVIERANSGAETNE
jgi:peptide/nickel transport system ATP-binding protein/oligopeptide transport system ATP-binding protein